MHALAHRLLLFALMAADGKLPPGVNRAWLQADLDLISQVRRALPPDPTRAELAGLSGNVSPPEQIDLGFGMVRHKQRAGGGYMSCDVLSVTHEQALISLQVTCWGEPPKAAQTRPIIERALGPAFARVEEPWRTIVYRAKYDFPETDRRARAALDRQLGPLAPVTVPAALASAYATLMSPAEELAVGRNCSEGGEPPAGAREAKALRAAGRLDLIRNVLRGPNPEARVYALAILKAMRAADAQDRTVIDHLSALPIEIESCRGCDFGRSTIKDALQALD
jgi:hypothetical protein